MIRLTPEQREAVEHDGNLLLTACPGSGKTRVILAKLLTLADQVVGTPQFIGCITYTNAAVDEIEARLRTYGNNAIADRVKSPRSTLSACNSSCVPIAGSFPKCRRRSRCCPARTACSSRS